MIDDRQATHGYRHLVLARRVASVGSTQSARLFNRYSCVGTRATGAAPGVSVGVGIGRLYTSSCSRLL